MFVCVFGFRWCGQRQISTMVDNKDVLLLLLLICDNFALIRDNTNYENIFYYINSLYIEKTYILNVIFVNYLTYCKLCSNWFIVF